MLEGLRFVLAPRPGSFISLQGHPHWLVSFFFFFKEDMIIRSFSPYLFDVFVFSLLFCSKEHIASFLHSHILCPLPMLVDLTFTIFSICAFDVCRLYLSPASNTFKKLWTPFIKMLCLDVAGLYRWLVTYSQVSGCLCSSLVQLPVPNLCSPLYQELLFLAQMPSAHLVWNPIVSKDLTAWGCSEDIAKPPCSPGCLLS